MTTTRSLIAAALLGAVGCSGSFGTLDSVLKGDRLASAAELGEVSVVRPGVALPTEPGMPLKKGDRVVTGPDVRALISLVGGYELILEPSTDIEILNPSLFMRVGQAVVRTVQGVSQALKLKTTFVVAGVEGTQFEVKVVGSEFLVSVVEGQVTVQSPTGAWPPAVYGAMQRGRVRGDAPPERMPPLQEQDARAIREKFVQVDQAIRRRVPRLVGMSGEAARGALREAGLGPGRVRETITGAPVGSVIAQEPAAGQIVRAGGRVDLTIEAESVMVPNLRGQSARAAALTLGRAGMRVGRILDASPVESANSQPGTILSQSPAAGSTVRRGSVVDIQVAAKPAPCVVPSLRGLTVAAARSRLSRARLQLGRVQTSGDDGTAADPIERQSPQAGTSATCGSAVDVVVAGRLR